MPSLRQAYERQARSPALSEHWSGPPQMVERIAGAIGTRARHRVLDVGSGLGGPARRLAAVVGCEVLAVDIVERVVREASHRHGSVRYLVADAEALPLGSATVDQVWMLGALAHLMDIGRAVGEAARVLRPRGRLAATEAFWESNEPPRFARSAPRPWRPLTLSETVNRLAVAGFKAVWVLEWPGEQAGQPVPSDPLLAADLASGRLRSRMVVGTRA